MVQSLTKYIYYNEYQVNNPDTKYVYTGEIAVTSNNGLLISSPLGSCVAVTAFEEEKKIGGMAHIMLPGKAPGFYTKNKNLYTFEAIESLIASLKQKGANPKKMKICFVGGANVLKKENDTISKQLVNSIISILNKKHLQVMASVVGGYERRVVFFNLNTKEVFYTEGDTYHALLHKFD